MIAKRLFGAACMLAFAAIGHAQDRASHSGPAELPAHVETRHSLTLSGHALDYRAVAETIGLTDRKGDPTASIFTIAYLSEGQPQAGGGKRPVAFVFNGGPGAAAVFLHLGALGPRVIEMPATGAVPRSPVKLIDNPDTWLAFTDLVFIDPVGTGFSRGEGKDDNPDKRFWNVQDDIESLAAVVRRWLVRHDRWGSPVFLVGESYGGLRAAGLARELGDETGLAINGLVLVSPALDAEILHPDVTNGLAWGFALASEAASNAALTGQSPTEAASGAEHFALSDYLVGLAALSGIPAAGDPFIGRIANLTGVPEEIVQRNRGRVSSEDFVIERLRDKHEILSTYDGTVARPAASNPWDDHAGDPILGPVVAAYNQAFEEYALNELGYRTELPYRVLAGQVARQWNWDDARKGENGLGLALTALQRVLLARPTTKLMVANGRYDLVTPYLGSRWLIDQLSLPPALRADIRLKVYEGGHMMYMRPQSRAALSADAAALFAAAAPTP